jgi:cupin fold WbuC family metalloprotein
MSKPSQWVGPLLTQAQINQLGIIDKFGISRYCYHSSLNSALHVMLISIPPSTVYPFHRHRNTDEFYYTVRGQMSIAIMRPDTTDIEILYLSGEDVSDSFNANGNRAFLVSQMCWHQITSGDEGVVFVETRSGPYDPQQTDFFDSASSICLK